VRVRRLAPADEPAVRALQSLLEYADSDLVDAALDGPFLGRVAIEDGAVVGYAIALPGRETVLSELAVVPGSRRSGHGRALVEAVAAAAGPDRLVVTTPAGDERAVTFYESLGFEADERFEGFYENGARALRLVRRE